MLYASITKDSKILLVEDCGGLLLGAVAQKLQNQGTITLCNLKSQRKTIRDYKIFQELNLDAEIQKSIEFKTFEDLKSQNSSKIYTQ